MKPKILILGATGVLGIKLIKYLHSQNLKVHTAVCNQKSSLLNKLSIKYKIHRTYSFNKIKDNLYLESTIKKFNFDIIYCLDSDLTSFPLIIKSLNFQKNCIFAIANKDLIIAGGKILVNKILASNNLICPLDSEHFSLIDLFSLNKNDIKNIYITASGGPFYFKKKNFDRVSKDEVLNHPKWKMGTDISIDSSNFMNKIFEIFELSNIYNISLKKIDFMISQDAYVHSVIVYKDGRYSFNIFKNDMLIPLVKPLENFGYFKKFNTKLDLENYKSFRLGFRKADKRFKIFKKINSLKKFSHCDQINFLILNKKAHGLYLSNKLKYNNIIDYVFKNLKKLNKNYKFRSLNDIVKYINYVQNKI